MTGPVHRDRHSPGLYLAVALVALGAAMAPRFFGEVERQAAIAEVSPRFEAMDQEIHAFWSAHYAEQFPQARYSYRRPTLRYYQPSIEPDQGGDMREALAFYDSGLRQMRVNLDKQHQVSPFVIAHEYGHHIQYLSGLGGRFERMERAFLGDGETAANAVSVRVELQAECLAGVWAHHAAREGILITERDVRAESTKLAFLGTLETHGTGAQRSEWFRRGYRRGRAVDCDTLTPEWGAL